MDGWRKGSRCAADSPQCVEVRRLGDGTRLVRNSEDPENVVSFNAAEWAAFVGSVRDGDPNLI